MGECYTKKKGQGDGRMQYMELAQDIIKEVKGVVSTERMSVSGRRCCDSCRGTYSD